MYSYIGMYIYIYTWMYILYYYICYMYYAATKFERIAQVIASQLPR